MRTPAARTLAALALQLAALAALAAALLGASWLDARSRPRLVVLVDRSQSMPRAATDAALLEVEQAAHAAGAGDVQRIEFARRPAAPGGAPLDASATDLEAALDAALAVHARRPLAGAVMISDGQATAGDTERALRALRAAELPLHWLALGRPAPAVRIVDVRAPRQARVGQRVRLDVQVQAAAPQTLRLRASVRGADGSTRSSVAAAGRDGAATLEFDAWQAGALVVDLAVEDAASAVPVAAQPAAAAIDVAARAPILVVQGGRGALASSLAAGGWPLRVVDAAQADALAGELAGCEAVVLDDVAVGDAGPRFWSALVEAVRQRGVGLLVLGGERSFARGGYRGSALETLLPVLSEPAALDRNASVLFLVDKSGSMGEGSGGIDRFALAQRAVLETARSLGAHDELGLVVFDVAPRVLLPLAPAAQGLAALESPWPATPHGGTRLAPAIDAAAAELERAGAARRLLVLVTDGFVEGVSAAALRARLERARVETVALAVGPDADAPALQRIVGAKGLVLRVQEAAELPAVMRGALERRRARVERGPFAVAQAAPLPFAPGTFDAWPEVDAYLATKARPGAAVVLRSARGDPLLAWQRAGLGRVVALTSGLGAWTPRWLSWAAWPQLAGGLAEWAGGASRAGLAALTVRESGSGLQIEVAQRAVDAAGADPGPLDLQVDAPGGRGRVVPAEPLAPGRWRAELPTAGPGLYTVTAANALGSVRGLYLLRAGKEDDAWGTNPELARWQAAGLLERWRPGALQGLRAPPGAEPPPDRSLLALALACFAAGMLVDRWPPRAQALRTLRRHGRALLARRAGLRRDR